MKIINLLIAFIPWFESTISTRTEPDNEYTLAVKSTLMHRIRPPVLNLRSRLTFDVHEGDKIVIRKVIDGQFAPKDIVHGILVRYEWQDYQTVWSDNRIVDGQHGRVEVTLGILNYAFYVALKRNEGYQDQGHNTGPVEYFCTIHRNGSILWAAVLRNLYQHYVDRATPRVSFGNHLHPNSTNIIYNGELCVANRPKMESLLANL